MNTNSPPSPGAQNSAQGRAAYVVVAGVELDETGDHTLSEVFALARREPLASVHLVSVVTDVGKALRSEGGADDHASLLEERMFSLRAFVLKRWRSYPPNAAHRVMMHVGLGNCERELVQFAIDYEADLLVVGTHDRGRLTALLSPSLADALAHAAPCPVLVARPRAYEGLSKSPSIEPPPLSPPAPHGHPRRAHRYRYSENLSFGSHDGNAITTGAGS